MTFPKHSAVKAASNEWVGTIPAHWEETRLRFVAGISNSNVDKLVHEGQVPIRLCNYTDVYYNERITADLDFMASTASEAEIKKFSLRKGDVIITKDSEDPWDIGIPAIVECDMPDVVCGYHLSIVRAGDCITADFIRYAFMSAINKARMFVRTPGVTRFGLSQDTIKNTLILMPPMAERKQIVDRLRKETARIDQLINRKLGFIKLLQEKSWAIAAHAVTGGIALTNDVMEDAPGWLGQVPSHWKMARVAELFREVVRPADPDLPVLAVSIHHGVSDKELDDEDRARKVNLSEDRTKYQRVQPGDLVYNMMRAWQGAFGTVTVDGLVSPAYVVAEPKAGFRTKFIELQLRTASGAEEVRRYSKGIADFRQRLYWEHFRNLRARFKSSSGVAIPCGSADEHADRSDHSPGG